VTGFPLDPWHTIDLDTALAEIVHLAETIRRNPPRHTTHVLGITFDEALWDVRGALRALRHTARHTEENR
jgi:hypothetical protein